MTEVGLRELRQQASELVRRVEEVPIPKEIKITVTDTTKIMIQGIDKKLVGPAYKDVAAKYAGDKDAEAKLATKIMKGGSGVWGPVPMPANPQVSEAEAKQLAAWVLTQK